MQDQRGRRNPEKQLWEEGGRATSELPDVDELMGEARGEQPDAESLIRDATAGRQEVRSEVTCHCQAKVL